MKAAVIEKQGGVENIVYRDWPDPEVRPDDVLIRVRACGLNHLDIFVRRGMPGFPVPMPFISGGDIAGDITEVGSGVADWAVGDRVIVNPMTDEGMIGEQRQGGMAELIAVPASHLIGLPDQVPFEVGAAIPVNYGTATRMLVTHGEVAPGELVLVIGASGGIGVAAVQIAKLVGARVIAAAGSAEKCVKLSDLGADHVIDYSTQDFSREAWRLSGKQGVDVVINSTGGDTWVASLKALRPQGRLITCGATAGFDPQTDIRYIWVRELRILGSNGYSQDEIATAARHVAEGRLSPVISHRFALAELGQAETLMERRDFLGKIVLLP